MVIYFATLRESCLRHISSKYMMASHWCVCRILFQVMWLWNHQWYVFACIQQEYFINDCFTGIFSLRYFGPGDGLRQWSHLALSHLVQHLKTSSCRTLYCLYLYKYLLLYISRHRESSWVKNDFDHLSWEELVRSLAPDPMIVICICAKCIEVNFQAFITSDLVTYTKSVMCRYFCDHTMQGWINVFTMPLDWLYKWRNAYETMLAEALQVEGCTPRRVVLQKVGQPLTDTIQYLEDIWCLAIDSPGALCDVYSKKTLVWQQS